MYHFLRRRRLLLSVSATLFLWCSGLLDRLFSTSFEHFKWADDHIDVYQETQLLLQGLPSRARIVNNWNNMHTLHTPVCLKDNADSTYELLIIVKSAVHNTKSRDVIRETWGRTHSVDDFRIRTVFVVGKFETTKEQLSMAGAIERESEINGDILVVDVVDTYRNNTAKFMHSISLAFHPPTGCSSPDFLLLIDDDYMLSTHNLVRLLDERSPSEHLYEGWRFDTSPFRFKLAKHAVSVSVYPYNRYPPYISAGCVLLSRLTYQHFYHAIQLVESYPMDDIYAGILSHLLKIEPRHNEGFVFWSTAIAHEKWMHGEVIAAHDYSPEQMERQYPLVRFVAPG